MNCIIETQQQHQRPRTVQVKGDRIYCGINKSMRLLFVYVNMISSDSIISTPNNGFSGIFTVFLSIKLFKSLCLASERSKTTVKSEKKKQTLDMAAQYAHGLNLTFVYYKISIIKCRAHANCSSSSSVLWMH